MRLIDGVGSPCDPLYTGILEIFNEGRWGAVCTNGGRDAITADVVCRQLGFPFGNPVDGDFARRDDDGTDPDTLDESEVMSDPVWLFGVSCRGPEENLSDCLGDYDNFSDGTSDGPCRRRLHVACRQFAVDAALEESSETAGAKCTPLPSLHSPPHAQAFCHMPQPVHGLSNLTVASLTRELLLACVVMMS